MSPAAPDAAVRSPAGESRTLPPAWWWGFALYAAISAVHVVALAAQSQIAGPTKILLMPVLGLAAVWALRGTSWSAAHTLLLAAIGLSWLGDGAATFFPFFADELPAMLVCFGLAHIAYMWLFARHLASRPLPAWSLVFALWWGVLLAVLWPFLGALAIPVAVYGLVLGGTAVLATRCHPAVLVGGVFFLTSDTLLAFRLFVPGLPEWLSPAVMVTYTLGQGLIAAGAVLTLHARRKR